MKTILETKRRKIKMISDHSLMTCGIAHFSFERYKKYRIKCIKTQISSIHYYSDIALSDSMLIKIWTFRSIVCRAVALSWDELKGGATNSLDEFSDVLDYYSTINIQPYLTYCSKFQ